MPRKDYIDQGNKQIEEWKEQLEVLDDIKKKSFKQRKELR